MADAKREAYDEDAAIERARERCAVPHPRDILKAEPDRILRGQERDVALEKHGPAIEAEALRELERSSK